MSKKTGGSKIPSHPEHFKLWLAGKNPGPLVVEVGPVHGCNHDCVHCGFQQFARYGDRRLIDPDAFLAFIHDFKEMGGVEIFFAGNGEPLLHPQLPDFIECAHGLGLDVTMSSNAGLLTPELARRIVPLVKWIRFSVNGGNPQTHARVHRAGPGEFETVIANIQHAVDIRKAAGSGALLLLQFILYDLNRDSLEDMVAAHERIGTDTLSIRNVFFKTGSPELDPQTAERLARAERTGGVNVRWDTFRSPDKTLSWKQCHGIGFRTTMDDRGNLFTCYRQSFLDSIYGNIAQSRFRDIWNSNRKHEVFREVASGDSRHLCSHLCPVAFDNALLQSRLPENEDE